MAPQPILPDVYPEIQDGALGILPPPTDSVSAKIGIASDGPVNEIVVVTDLDQVRETFGSGPLAEALATHLALSGAPVLAVRTAATVNGTVGTPNHTAQGDGTATLTGSPRDSYLVRARITRPGAVGEAALEISLDGGITWGPERALPVGGEIPLSGTGLTLEFEGADPTAFQEGDAFSWDTTAPAYTLEELTSALDVLLGDAREWGHVHVVGESTPAVFAGVSTKMLEAENNYRFAFALLDAEPNTDSNLLQEWGNSASTRVAVSSGSAAITSPLTGRVAVRPAGWLASGRISAVPVHEHLGRIITGPVHSIVSLTRDEFRTPGLDAGGFLTLRTVIGRAGFYFTRGRMKAPEGSDYQFIESRRVMDLACRIGRNAFMRFLNDSVRVDAAGNILEADALAIEAYVEGQLLAGVVTPGHANAVQVSVKRDTNILSTRRTVGKIRVRPLGYLEWIEMDIGFDNPALQPA